MPEFFYLPMYDELHRAMSVPSDQKENYIQKGVREYLLCRACETRLSRYEGYAAKLIKEIPNFSKDEKGLFVYSDGVDYKQFKLFQLSVLWRASISQNRMFVNVNLGGKHEERIRNMLDKGTPGKSTDYGCIVLMIPDPKKIHRVIWSPTRGKILKHNGYRFMTGNLFWHFIASSHPIDKTLQPFFVQETGRFTIWISPWSEQDVYSRIAKAMQSRRIK
ncbi:MAG: hypothetical protein ACOYZ8_19155 [Chloroflexota bacterium]